MRAVDEELSRKAARWIATDCNPKHPDLVSPVGRHGKLTAGYVDDAVDTINILIKREGLSDK